MKGMRRFLTAVLMVPAVFASVSGVTVPASARPARWAPAGEATIHPGVQTRTASADPATEGGGQCTANFVFVNGADVLLGQAAHCAGTGAANEVDGCEAGSLPLGTPVEVEGASRPAALVYSSWLTMQAAGETDENACLFNDFALLRLDPADHDKVNPSLPVYGGPVGMAKGSDPGENVYTYGNSSLRGGIAALSPKEGYSLGENGDGWNHTIYTVTPGVPGDSGSAVLDSNGGALGVLVTLAVLPLTASNGVTDLDRALDYARSHASVVRRVKVAGGAGAFNGGTLP